jgi:dTDP-4-dehydrorhamnose reductase
LRRGEDVVACDKTIVSPTYVPDLVHASLDLMLDGETGIWHLTNQGAVSWHELACEVADLAKVEGGRVLRAKSKEKADTSLSSKRGLMLRPLDQALGDWVAHSPELHRVIGG